MACNIGRLRTHEKAGRRQFRLELGKTMGFGGDKLSLGEGRCDVAGVTGLEPAASGVTGRRSNQLSYTPSRMVGDDGIEPPTLSV